MKCVPLVLINKKLNLKVNLKLNFPVHSPPFFSLFIIIKNYKDQCEYNYESLVRKTFQNVTPAKYETYLCD